MKTKYLYDLLKKIRPWHAVSLVAAVTLSAIIVASAMKLDPTAANNPVAEPQPASLSQGANDQAPISTITENSTTAAQLSGPIKVLDYHGNIDLVPILLDQLAQQNGWSVTHVSPSAFANMTSDQIQSFNILFILSGSASNNACGTDQWGGVPDFSGLLQNPNVGVATVNGRKVITGLDSDWHALFHLGGGTDVSKKFLTGAINWVGSGPSTGYVTLADGGDCSEWWELTGSFLLPLFTAPGVNLTYGGFEAATVVDPTHPVVQGSPGVITYCCHHIRISGTIPGFTTLMDDPVTHQAVTLVSEPTPTKLRVIKHVLNDNGGTAVASDFTMTVTGNNPAPASFPGDENGTTVNLDAGNYSVAETGPSGYTANSSAECSGSIAVNQTITCTITNDDQTAHLKLVKQVSNDNGGTTVATDFILSATGPTSISGPGGVESDVNAGIYTLSETGPSGYTASTWVCVGGAQSGSQITLALGQSATCTITNDDQTAHLKLVKDVTNDNGGTAVPTDFILSADGPTPISGPGGVESDVSAGIYNLSETGPSGYTDSTWVCTDGAQSGSQITLALGQSATCTITNDDNQSYITVVKDVINDDGGLAAPDDFNLTLDGNPVISGVLVPVNPGTYTAGETLIPGYTFEGFSGDCDSNGNVTIALGESKTCTLTNNDIPRPPIKVTGGGQIPVPEPTSRSQATFGFNAQQTEAGSTAASGHFNYVNHDTGLHINGSVNDIQVIALNPDGSPKTVQFSGTCEGPGPACTFIVTVEDNGEPGTSDEFGITVTGDVSEFQSQRLISKGNIQFHIQ